MSEAWFSPGGERPRQDQDGAPSELPEVQLQNTPLDKEAVTERILDRVIESAENNEPLEAQYERSHEIKDNSNPISFAPMQSIGAILEEQQSLHTPSGPSIDPNITQTIGVHTPAFSGKKLSYTRAMLSGVGVALGVIIIISIYLLLK